MEGRQLLVRFGADLGPLEKAVIGASRKLQAFGKEVVAAGKALSAAITVPLAGAATAATVASETLVGAMNTIRRGTGAVGADLESLGKTMRAVYGSLPASAAEVGTAIADLNTRAGLTGSSLESMAKQMLNLAKVAGIDVAGAIASTQKAFSSWGVAIRDQGAALDLLWKVSQSTGIGVMQLADGLARGGAGLRALGIPLTTATIMLGGFERAGISTEVMLAGLRMAATKFAVAGQDIAGGMARVTAAIKGAPSETQAAALAVAAFGEAGITMSDAIRRGALDVNALTASIAASTETVNRAAEDTRTLGDRFAILGNKVTIALEPLGKALTEVMMGLLPLFTSATNALAALVGAFSRLPGPAQSALVVMGGLAAAVGPAMLALGAMIVGVGKVAVAILSLKATAGPALAAVAAVFASAAGPIAAAWASVVGVFSGAIAVMTPAILSVTAAGMALVSFAGSPVALAVAAMGLVAVKWDWLRGQLLAVAEAIPGAIGAMWSDMRGLVMGGAETLRSAVAGVGAMLASAARVALGPYYDSVASVMTSVWEYAEKAWSRLKSGVAEVAAWIQAKLQGVLDAMGGIVGRIVDLASRAARAVVSVVSPGANPKPAAGGAAGISTPGVVSGASSQPGVGSMGGGPVSSAAGASVTERDVTLGNWATSGKLLGAQAPSRDWLYKAQAAEASAPTGGVTTAFPGPAMGFLSQPRFRRLADGGIVDRPGGMLALIGESGPEAVVPLSGRRVGAGAITVNVHVTGSVATQADLAEQIRRSLIRLGQRTGSTGLV